MNRTAAALLAITAVVAIGGTAQATIIPPPDNPAVPTLRHPTGTVTEPFLPDGCRVRGTVHAEQYRRYGIQVREVVVYRLRCRDHARSLVRTGPWLSAYLPLAPQPQPEPEPMDPPEPTLAP